MCSSDLCEFSLSLSHLPRRTLQPEAGFTEERPPEERPPEDMASGGRLAVAGGSQGGTPGGTRVSVPGSLLSSILRYREDHEAYLRLVAHEAVGTFNPWAIADRWAAGRQAGRRWLWSSGGINILGFCGFLSLPLPFYSTFVFFSLAPCSCSPPIRFLICLFRVQVSIVKRFFTLPGLCGVVPVLAVIVSVPPELCSEWEAGACITHLARGQNNSPNGMSLLRMCCISSSTWAVLTSHP